MMSRAFMSIAETGYTPALSRRFLDPEIVQRVLKVSDFIVLFAGTTALFMQSAISLDPQLATMMTFASMVMVFATLLALRGLGAYHIRSLLQPLRSTLLAASFCALAGVIGFLMIRAFVFELPVSWLAGWLLIPAIHFSISRFATASWLAPRVASGMLRQPIAIVGGGKAAEDAIGLLERSPASIRTHRKLGRIAELAEFARLNRIDLVVVAIPLSAEERLLQVLYRLWGLPVDIRISGQSSKLRFAPTAYEYLGELPMLSVFDRPLAGWSAIIKSAMDRVVGLCALVILSPLMLATAVAVRLESKGPVLLKQKRYGFNNELVEVWKFRPMYTEMSDANAAKLVTKDDPRVTRVGRFIRKTSINELPQLFNVLKGELSLVGPRPHATQAKAATELYEQVVDGYFARHKVEPCITGWA
jgi:exopolysaccharide biosynthesis polyprenyl glycosylphosphotransferase